MSATAMREPRARPAGCYISMMDGVRESRPSALDLPLTVTYFADEKAYEKQERNETLRKVAERAETLSAATKEKLPWIKLAQFGDEATSKGSLRHGANMASISGVEGDYDAGEMTPEAAAEKLKYAEIAAVVVTSPGHHTFDKEGKWKGERWRVLCPLSRPHDPAERKRLLARVNGALGGVLAGESFTMSQAYYIGKVGEAPQHRAILVEGRALDEAPQLDAGAIGRGGGTSSLGTIELPSGIEPSERGDAALTAACALFDDEGKLADNGRHATMLAATKAVAPYVLSGDVDKAVAIAEIEMAMESCELGRAPGGDEVKRAMEGALKISRPYEDPRGAFSAFVETEEERQAREEAAAKREAMRLDRSDPLPSARAFVKLHHHVDGQRTLHRHNGAFYCWTGTHYREAHREETEAALYRFLDGAVHRTIDNKTGAEIDVPFAPNRDRVGNVLAALGAVTLLPATTNAPVWLGSANDRPPAHEMLACANGLLHLPTRQLLPHSPAFFSVNALPYAYEPDAPVPANWLAFLQTLWPNDRASIETLQELFGLLLTGDTRQHKVFLLVGPPRSGKGTIGRVVVEMLGRENCCNPTLASLGQQFGMASLIGKTLATISDARLGRSTDPHNVTERLLSISGEDQQTIARKYAEDWTGYLPTRFVVMSNELPRLTDASGALASRFIILQMTQSFLGREDHGLTARLLTELPGILNWSMDGLARLSERGHFVQPAAAADAVAELADLASPIKAFLEDFCEIGPSYSVDVDDLFRAWLTWCTDQHRDAQGTKQTFGRDLQSAIPKLSQRRPRDTRGKRLRVYDGLRLLPHATGGSEF